LLELLQAELQQQLRPLFLLQEQVAALRPEASQLRLSWHSPPGPAHTSQPSRKRRPSELQLEQDQWKPSWLLLAFHPVSRAAWWRVPGQCRLLQHLPLVLLRLPLSHQLHPQR